MALRGRPELPDRGQPCTSAGCQWGQCESGDSHRADLSDLADTMSPFVTISQCPSQPLLVWSRGFTEEVSMVAAEGGSAVETRSLRPPGYGTVESSTPGSRPRCPWCGIVPQGTGHGPAGSGSHWTSYHGTAAPCSPRIDDFPRRGTCCPGAQSPAICEPSDWFQSRGTAPGTALTKTATSW